MLRVYYEYDGSETVLETDLTSLVIGRGTDRVSVDLDLSPDASVSRKHAMLRVLDNGVWLTDMGSRRGTLVNHRNIAGAGWVSVSDQDRVVIGRTRLRFDGLQVRRDAPALSESTQPATIGAAEQGLQSLIGATIGGCRLLESLGQGAMGTVFRATQVDLDRPVAFKMLRPELAGDATHLQRMRREAMTAGRFRSPNVVQVFNAGFDKGSFFIVMELIDGPDLHRYSASFQQRCVPQDIVARLLRDAVVAMCEAEALSVLHRDLKPSNMLLDQNGSLKIADFGLAKLMAGSGTARLTRRGVAGTPPFMSPEQLAGLDLDSRSDMYSLGTSMYSLLTGDVPFKHIPFNQLGTAKAAQQEMRPKCANQELADVIARMTHRDAEQRFDSFAKLAELLPD